MKIMSTAVKEATNLMELLPDEEQLLRLK